MENQIGNHMEHVEHGIETEILQMFIGMISSVLVLDSLCHDLSRVLQREFKSVLAVT